MLQPISIGATPRRPHLTLHDLAGMTYAELEAMYRAAAAPASLRAADGKLVGRMLAMRHADRGLRGRWLRRLALSPSFIWEGKTLAAHADHAGGGYNRICLEGVLGRQHIFPFDSYLAPSQFDHKPTIVIDYDRPSNPWFMRRIRDELRELEPGLFLGLDMWKTKQRAVGLVWFALDGR